MSRPRTAGFTGGHLITEWTGGSIVGGHRVGKGDKIRCMKDSRIWLSVGEIFTVEGLVISEITGEEGVLFFDRFGGKRVFWSTEEYECIHIGE